MDIIIKTLLLIVPALVCSQASAETGLQNADWKLDALRTDSSIIFGEGWGTTYADADRAALADLTSKISVNVSSSFQLEEEELYDGHETDTRSATRSIIHSYTQSTLTNTGNVVLETTPEFHVARYISRSELERLFEARKEKVYDYVRSALRSEKSGKIDDCLRNYFWAFTLLRTLQEPSSVKMKDVAGDRLLTSWIPEQINHTLDKLSVEVAGNDGDDFNLLFKYDGVPVKSVEYSYFDGQHWSGRYAAKDGMGTMELMPGTTFDKIQLRFEYEYADQTHLDPELQAVCGILKNSPFPKSYRYLATRNNGQELEVNGASKKQFQQQVTNASTAIESVKTKPKELSRIMKRVIASIETKNPQSVADVFTTTGMDMYMKLLHYGKVKLIGEPKYCFYDIGDRKVCRSIPMSFSFNNNRRFIEDVTFTFNSDGKIDTVAFGLGEEARTAVFDKGIGAWSDYAKMVIVTFLENYKTAFALKRLDYIKDIFDDNATIIVGNVAKKTTSGNKELGYNLSGDVVNYTRLTKNQYLTNLERCFKSNQFINVRFGDTDVVKMGVGGEMYGIQLKQDYYSSTYGDKGYLFLIVDFNEPELPQIKVRTWQPERNPDINPHLPHSDRDWGIIGPGNF